MDSVLLMTLLFSSVLVSSIFAACPEIVTRELWGAKSPKSVTPLTTPVNHVFIHHTAGSPCTNKDSCKTRSQQIQNYHMNNKKWDDIGYSFLVGGDGNIYEGRGWKAVGAHTVNYNSKSFGISVMGNFDQMEPTTIILNAIKNLIDCGVEKGYITKSRQIHGHRDAKCTACPGSKLYSVIKGWTGFKGGRLPGYTC